MYVYACVSVFVCQCTCIYNNGGLKVAYISLLIGIINASVSVHTQSVTRTIVTDLVYENIYINILQKFCIELLLLFESNYAINVNMMLINFSKWGRGTSEGVTRVAPYLAFPPFIIVIIES